MKVDSVEYHAISKRLTLSAPLAQISVESRRNLFSALFMDKEVCPGQKSMTAEAQHQAQQSIALWCGWGGV